MGKKEELIKVQFWIGKRLKSDIDNFAHSINLAACDFYKGGAVLLKKLFENPAEINLNLFTKNLKDLERSHIQKEILRRIKLDRGAG